MRISRCQRRDRIKRRVKILRKRSNAMFKGINLFKLHYPGASILATFDAKLKMSEIDSKIKQRENILQRI